MSDLRRSQAPSRPAGFTLVELLVVIAIIVLLISILLPVAGRVRIQAQSAKTQSLIAAIGGAIERYYLDDRAYPGPWSNTQMAAGVSPVFTGAPAGAGAELTMSEACVAALVGGPQPNATNPNNPPTVDLSANTTIGKGPMTFSPAKHLQVRRTPYMDAAPGTNLPSEPFSASGCAANAIEVPGTPPTTKDSGFPEFIDSYSDARPIIYLRANVGATGIASAMSVKNPNPPKQYTTYEFNYYKRGVSGNFPGDFVIPSSDPDGFATMDDYIGHSNVADTAKGKDKFLLISAGADRVYGTRDDIFFGGSR